MKTITYDETKWALVPVELTEAMRKAGVARYDAYAEVLRDAARWRGVKARHGMALVRLATGGTSYSSNKKDAVLDAWADMASAEVDAFDPETYRAERDAAIDAAKEKGGSDE